MRADHLNTEKDDQEMAHAVLARIASPPEIGEIRLEFKEDHSGDPAIYLSFEVKDGVSVDREAIARISRYMAETADQMLRSGISRFPYVSLDEAA